MYWNTMVVALAQYNNMININMRCIEIGKGVKHGALLKRLTLTWDVLKCFKG